jgi:carboxyl-terminal processing protease
MSLRRVLAAILAVVVVLVAFVGGVVVGGHAGAVGLTQLNDPLRGWILGNSGQDLSAQVLQLLEDRYYKPVDQQQLEDASVDALIGKLNDPYTDYLSPKELQELRDHTDRIYYGVGLQVAERGKEVVVVRVYDGSPAAQQGVKKGDRIVSVDGRDAVGKSLESVVGQIRGDEGTKVTIGVRTGDAAPRELTLTRARIAVPAVDSRVFTRDGKKIGYIALAQFSRGAGDALRTTITSLRERGVDGLVFDLRGDPGGLVDEAVEIAGAFLPKGSTVVVTQGEHSARKVIRTTTDPVAGDLPLEVLVDRNSASASEIVAGALRDAKRGTLIGERTFGKALVQSTIPLRNGGALKLTTQRYLTPSGYDLAKRGLPPAVKVVDDPQTPRDEALQKALALAAAG